MTLRALVPLDGSDASFDALDGALRLLAERPGLHVTLFNVTSEGMEGLDEDRRSVFEDDEDDELFPSTGSGLRMMQRAIDACNAQDVPHERKIVEGKVQDAILEACAQHDVLIMHRLDKNQLKESLRGSQTERLVRRSPIPVLLV